MSGAANRGRNGATASSAAATRTEASKSREDLVRGSEVEDVRRLKLRGRILPQNAGRCRHTIDGIGLSYGVAAQSRRSDGLFIRENHVGVCALRSLSEQVAERRRRLTGRCLRRGEIFQVE